MHITKVLYAYFCNLHGIFFCFLFVVVFFNPLLLCLEYNSVKFIFKG